MNLTAWFFAIASLLGWCLWLAEHQRAVRELRRLECQHKLALARKHIVSVRAGMMGERWRWQAGPRLQRRGQAQEAAQRA